MIPQIPNSTASPPTPLHKTNVSLTSSDVKTEVSNNQIEHLLWGKVYIPGLLTADLLTCQVYLIGLISAALH